MDQGKLEVVKQEMARVNVDILGISELKWTGMGEIDVFLELSCFFHGPEDVGNLISGSSAFSKTSLIEKYYTHPISRDVWRMVEEARMAPLRGLLSAGSGV